MTHAIPNLIFPSKWALYLRCLLLLIYYSLAFKGQHMAAEVIFASTTKQSLHKERQ